ncbi:MAG: hypothetical protein QM840_01115 [Verrucomicrobiota bacterium]|nr:hypothetical protein [Verrucomicrobiota bacterium]
MYYAKSYVHPVSIPCTPLVHGSEGGRNGAAERLAQGGGCGIEFRTGCPAGAGDRGEVGAIPG